MSNDQQPPLRSLPQAGSSEAAVLGSMIINPRCIGSVIDLLGERDFAFAEHQVIWRAIMADYGCEIGENLDGLTVRQRLEGTGELGTIGGTEYLQKVVESVPTAQNALYYARRVLAVSRQRQLIQICTELGDKAYGDLEDVAPLLEEAERRIFRMVDRGQEGDAEPVGDLVARAFAAIKKRCEGGKGGIGTGFFELDQMLGGLEAGQMVIVAGRPSSGKSALAMNIAEHAALIEKAPTLVMSLEMDKTQLMQRAICGRARLDSTKIRNAQHLDASEYQALVVAAGEYHDVPLWIDESAAVTPMHLRSKCRRWKHMHDLKLVVVDYLQLMHVAGKTESRQQEIAAISRHIKNLARELGVPIIALSQLNRQVENRENHRPRMSDLRESGSLENDADVIMLLHREDYYHRDDVNWEPTNTAEVIVAKQRNGPTGTVNLAFAEKFTRFDNLSQTEMWA